MESDNWSWKVQKTSIMMVCNEYNSAGIVLLLDCKLERIRFENDEFFVVAWLRHNKRPFYKLKHFAHTELLRVTLHVTLRETRLNFFDRLRDFKILIMKLIQFVLSIVFLPWYLSLAFWLLSKRINRKKKQEKKVPMYSLVQVSTRSIFLCQTERCLLFTVSLNS